MHVRIRQVLYLLIVLTGKYALSAPSPIPCEDNSLIPFQLYIPREQIQRIVEEVVSSILNTANGAGKLAEQVHALKTSSLNATTKPLNDFPKSHPERPQHIEPTGTKTRPVLDFTGKFKVGLSCANIRIKQNATESGLYLIHPSNLVEGPWKVYCDMETEGGGWTVFQTRDDVAPLENFTRLFEDYEVGFGDFDREFWLGNILLWAFTNDLHGGSTDSYELVIDMETFEGDKRTARYKSFRVGSKEEKYKLTYNGYSGNSGDDLAGHNNMPFSTIDSDRNKCANLYKGGWWYNNCHTSNLNGQYLRGAHSSYANGINWASWKGYNYSLKRTVMRLRPQKFPVLVDINPPLIQKRINVTELTRDSNTLTKPARKVEAN